MSSAKEKKETYFNKLISLCQEYQKIVIVNADNVGSRQMMDVRKQLRGKGVVLMGKNTMMRKAIKMFNTQTGSTKLDKIMPYVTGNIGFIFSNGDLSEVREILRKNKVGAPARQGTISPIDVVVPAGNTGMEPTKTSFFQALNIPTKITKGTVEIISDYHLLKIGDKVGNSEAALLQMLNIKPFSYALKIVNIYDNGSLYGEEILDITDNVILTRFKEGVSNVAALSLAVGIPNAASLPHSIANAFKNLLAVAVETEVSFKQADSVKAFIANPNAFAAAPVAAAAPAAASGSKAAPAPVVVEEEEEADLGLDLFG